MNEKLKGARGPFLETPGNLPGHLSGSFIGPEVAFLEAPVNFPGTYRGPEKIAGRYQTLARSLHGRPREKENELELNLVPRGRDPFGQRRA